MDEKIAISTELPPGIERAHSKETSRKRTPAAIHTWWARRSSAYLRVATYLGLTQKRDEDPSFLEALAAYPPSPMTMMIAARQVRDTQWRQAWREATVSQSTCGQEQEEVPDLPPPRILDPFCGAGGIPLEAARLGCSAYANDLSPVAFNITRATSYFPGKFGSADSGANCTNETGQWAGLRQELNHWTKVVSSVVESRIELLFPDTESLAFIWFNAAKCTSCGGPVPSQLRYTLTRDKSPTEVILSTEGSALQEESSRVSTHATKRGRLSVCLACGSAVDQNDSNVLSEARSLLGAVLTDSGFRAVARNETSKYHHWMSQYEERIREIKKSGWHTLDRPLPDIYAQARSIGYTTFADLFTPRQRLVALEYAVAIRTTTERMTALGMNSERVHAIATYLAFLVDFIVERNSKLCRWNPNSQRAEPAFAMARPGMPGVFVETHPRLLVKQWLDQILHALDELSTGPQIESVTCGEADQLPYPENFFDAVITEPPFFRNVPFLELSEYFWVWEQPILALDASKECAQSLEAPIDINPRFPRFSREDLDERYWRGYKSATDEIYRVIKPGSLFTLLLAIPSAAVFDAYISLSQEAGFELFNVRHLKDDSRHNLSAATEQVSYLIYFRKPQARNRGLRSETIGAVKILEAVDSDRPMLYEGLAKLLLEELDESEIKQLLTDEYKGTTFERLMEVLADRDLRELFVELFGRVGIPKLLRKLGIDQIGESTAPADQLLSHFGFSPPTPRDLRGAHQVSIELQLLLSRVALADDKALVRGLFLEGSTALERLLRSTIWAWASLAFGESRDTELLRILQDSSKGRGQSGDVKPRYFSLDLLAFGHIKILFRDLPEAIAVSAMATVIERKLGRRLVYNPVAKSSNIDTRLEEFIPIRNKIEHDKKSFWTNLTFGEAKSYVSVALTKATEIVSLLVRSRAAPAWAYTTHRIEDDWSRTTYRFVLENGGQVEARFTQGLTLGRKYLYFGGDVNPRPVDPLIISSDQIDDTP